MKITPVRIGAGVLLALLLLVGWRLYDLGKIHGVVELAGLRAEVQVLERHNKELVKESGALRDEIAILERSSQIDQQAAQAVKSELGQLEEALQASREEVEFYRGIVAPGDVDPGLRIHRFDLEEGLAQGEYHYDLVLTQLKRNDKFVSGVVGWKISGVLDGEPVELALDKITEPAVQQLKFRLRYFQDLAGTIKLPEGFVPDRIELTVSPKGKQPPVVQAFDWPAITG
ncbi:MAG: hypothetical protein OEU91_02525 [Gammaproteobacteria bacterium]|nr:hypothetical protein [Gammaproteobacteria bacterium]